MSTLVITQVKSANGANGRQRDTLRSLGLRGIGKTVERQDSPQLRGMVHAVRHLVTVESRRSQTGGERAVSDERAGRRQRGARGGGRRAASLKPAPGSTQGPQARRPRPRLGPRQDRRARPQGLRLARGRQGPRPLRGRPEPDPHADAQAARPEQEDVDAVRAVPDAHAAREPGRPRGAASTPARRSASTTLRSTGLAKQRDDPGQDPRPRRADEEANGHAPTSSRRAPASASRPPAGPALDIED